MRSILLFTFTFTFTFFLTACSDNSTNNNKTAPSNVSADKSVEQQVAVQTEPIKSVSKPAPVKTETEATAKKAAPVKGHTVFAHKCASCHGNNAEKAALNKSQVIEGWDEGIPGMKVGGHRILTIPPDMGYGDRGVDNLIPPNATLIFEVELVDVN